MKDNSGSELTLDLQILDRMQTDEPVAVYTKAIRAKVGVVVFNAYTMKPEYRILKGDTLDQQANKEEMIVKLFDERSRSYFQNANKELIEAGVIIPYKLEANTIDMANSITDEQIDEILEQPYFTLMNKIGQFTSVFPVERILIRAMEINKGVKTIDNIKARLAELQEKESLAINEKTLEQHYQNITK